MVDVNACTPTTSPGLEFDMVQIFNVQGVNNIEPLITDPLQIRGILFFREFFCQLV